MSDTAQGPGWWFASDGKWYPPELWTGVPYKGPAVMSAPQTLMTASPGSTPTHAAGAATPGRQSGYGAHADSVANMYPPHGYGQYPPYGTTTAPKTNGLAIASLICSCAGLLILPIFAGITLGFVARAQIKRSNGSQRGNGLAIGGIIVGFGWMVLIVLGLTVNAHSSTSSAVIRAMLAVLVGPLGLVS